MNLNFIEKWELNASSDFLTQNKTQIEQVTGPAVLTVVQGAVKVADGVFANLPFGFGALIDAALHKYVDKYKGDLGQYEGQGIDTLAALLKKIAAGL